MNLLYKCSGGGGGPNPPPPPATNPPPGLYEKCLWYGMVWYGMVWYGMVWYGMVWYGMVCVVGRLIPLLTIKGCALTNTMIKKQEEERNLFLVTTVN